MIHNTIRYNLTIFDEHFTMIKIQVYKKNNKLNKTPYTLQIYTSAAYLYSTLLHIYSILTFFRISHLQLLNILHYYTYAAHLHSSDFHIYNSLTFYTFTHLLLPNIWHLTHLQHLNILKIFTPTIH